MAGRPPRPSHDFDLVETVDARHKAVAHPEEARNRAVSKGESPCFETRPTAAPQHEAVSEDTKVNGKRILLIVGGGIAAYKSLDLVRRLKERGASVRAVLTNGGAAFVTPLSLSVLTEERIFTDLFDLKDEAEIGHIRLSREADLIVVAPATADLLAKMAHGLADDLATAVLLATDKKVLAAPAMNVRMWQHPATKRNLATLRADGVAFVGPDEGEMACGEYGMGRMAEPQAILARHRKDAWRCGN